MGTIFFPSNWAINEVLTEIMTLGKYKQLAIKEKSSIFTTSQIAHEKNTFY